MTATEQYSSEVRPVKVLATAVAASAIAGVLGGLVWAALAPPEKFVVVDPGRGAALTGESMHRFDGLALFVCIAFVGGVVLPVALWAWTAARGPVLCVGVFVGAAIGSVVMLGIGIWVAGVVHPRPVDPPAGSVVTLAPGFESALVLLVQPLVASLVVLLLAAMNPHDNLRFTAEDDQNTNGADAETGAAAAGAN